MGKKVKIIATPDGINGQNLSRTRQQVQDAATAAGYDVIMDYTSIDDLIVKVNAIVKKDPTNILQILEIHSHADPTLCDYIDTKNVKDVGQKFKDKLPWCDNSFLYLSGCNTATYHDGVEIPRKGPIAERLRAEMKYQSSRTDGTKFEVHLTIYGTKGYKGGTHMKGDTRTQKDSWDPVTETYHPEYEEGSENAKGDKCWHDYPNWK
jgi:hypothetical protein